MRSSRFSLVSTAGARRRPRSGTALRSVFGNQFHRVDRSFQTDARARPVRPGGGTASGASSRNRSLERHDLAAGIVARRREELDAPCHDLDRVATFAFLLPRPAADVAVDCDTAPFCKVLVTQLGLALPRGDPNEVRTPLLRA